MRIDRDGLFVEELLIVVRRTEAEEKRGGGCGISAMVGWKVKWKGSEQDIKVALALSVRISAAYTYAVKQPPECTTDLVRTYLSYQRGLTSYNARRQICLEKLERLLTEA